MLSLVPSSQVLWKDTNLSQSRLAICSIIVLLTSQTRLNLFKSRLRDMTLTRASCGFWALFSPPSYCTVCLVGLILSNNDECKFFGSYIWDLATFSIAFEPVYKDKIRVGEKLVKPRARLLLQY